MQSNGVNLPASIPYANPTRNFGIPHPPPQQPQRFKKDFVNGNPVTYIQSPPLAAATVTANATTISAGPTPTLLTNPAMNSKRLSISPTPPAVQSLEGGKQVPSNRRYVSPNPVTGASHSLKSKNGSRYFVRSVSPPPPPPPPPSDEFVPRSLLFSRITNTSSSIDYSPDTLQPTKAHSFRTNSYSNISFAAGPSAHQLNSKSRYQAKAQFIRSNSSSNNNNNNSMNQNKSTSMNNNNGSISQRIHTEQSEELTDYPSSIMRESTVEQSSIECVDKYFKPQKGMVKIRTNSNLREKNEQGSKKALANNPSKQFDANSLMQSQQQQLQHQQHLSKSQIHQSQQLQTQGCLSQQSQNNLNIIRPQQMPLMIPSNFPYFSQSRGVSPQKTRQHRSVNQQQQQQQTSRINIQFKEQQRRPSINSRTLTSRRSASVVNAYIKPNPIEQQGNPVFEEIKNLPQMRSSSAMRASKQNNNSVVARQFHHLPNKQKQILQKPLRNQQQLSEDDRRNHTPFRTDPSCDVSTTNSHQTYQLNNSSTHGQSMQNSSLQSQQQYVQLYGSIESIPAASGKLTRITILNPVELQLLNTRRKKHNNLRNVAISRQHRRILTEAEGICDEQQQQYPSVSEGQFKIDQKIPKNSGSQLQQRDIKVSAATDEPIRVQLQQQSASLQQLKTPGITACPQPAPLAPLAMPFNAQKEYDMSDEEWSNFGDRFPENFKKIKVLGRGGFAMVWLGVSTLSLEQFAVKQVLSTSMHKTHLKEIWFASHFFDHGKPKDEFKDIKGVKNLSTLAGYDVQEIDTWLFYEVGGESLGTSLYDIIDNEELPSEASSNNESGNDAIIYKIIYKDFYEELQVNLQLLKDLIIELAQAIDVISSKGLVHSDVKTENILLKMRRDANKRIVGVDGVKLIDYGSTFTIDNLKGFTMATPEYMAPEVLNYILHARKKMNHFDDLLRYLDDSQEYRNRPWVIDIWSLGCVLLEIIYGIPVWMSSRTQAIRKVRVPPNAAAAAAAAVNNQLRNAAVTDEVTSVTGTGLFAVENRLFEEIIQKQIDAVSRIDEIICNENHSGIQVDASIKDALKGMLCINPMYRYSPKQVIEALTAKMTTAKQN